MSRLPSLALVLVAASMAACTSAPDACVTVDAGQVCASTAVKARKAGERLDELARALRAELPELTSDPVDVWLQPRPQVVWFFPAAADVAAMTNSMTGRIHARESSPDLDTDLAHELVHALLGPAWDGLPPALEEGLCDQLASRVATDGRRLRADRLLKSIPAVGGPRAALRLDAPGGGWSEQRVHFTSSVSDGVDPREVFSRDSSLVRPFHGDRGRPLWYGLAFVAAGRLLAAHGSDGLLGFARHAAELDDEDAIAALADAAGLADADSWPAAILAEATPEDRATIAAMLADELAHVTLTTVRERAGAEGSLRARVEASRPRFRLGPGTEPTVDLLQVEDFVRALDAGIARAGDD